MIGYGGRGKELTAANLINLHREMDLLKTILDGWKCTGKENWRCLYDKQNQQDILAIEENTLIAISTNCHLKLGENVLINMCSSLTPVGKVLGFAEKEEHHDIAKILNGYRGKS